MPAGSWELLLDSRKITPQVDATALALWPDNSGNGRDANPVPGFNPNYRTGTGAGGSPNKQAMVDFGAVALSQMFGTLPAGGVGNAAGFSFYGYYIIDTLAKVNGFDSQVILADDIGSGFRMFVADFQAAGDNRNAGFFSTGGNHPVSAAQATTGGTHIFTVICSPPSGTGIAKLFLDNLLVATGTWGCNPNTTYLVSGNSVQNIGLKGRLGFAGFGKRVDSDFTRTGINNFLRRTFG